MNQAIDSAALFSYEPPPAQFDGDRGAGTFFRFYFLETSSGFIELNGRMYPLAGSCCLCLNETDTIQVNKLKTYCLHAIRFMPSVVNAVFAYQNIRQPDDRFNSSEVMDLYWLKPFLDRDDNFCGILQLSPHSTQRLQELCARLGTQLSDQTARFWPCRVRSYFFEMLGLVNSLIDNPIAIHSESANNQELAKRVIRHLNEVYNKKITIANLTTRFDTNRTTLSEVFSQATGHTIMEYLGKIRIRMACMLLANTTLPVKEIMFRTGFRDHVHFGRSFRKEMDCTPTQFRERLRTP